MKTLMKILIFMIFFAAIAWPISVAAQEAPIGLIVNGRALDNLPAPPVIREDRMLVPARAVFESLGATVRWQPAERSVYIQHQNQNVVVTIDRSTLMVNGQPAEMPVAAQIINDNTMIPVGAVATNLGFSVDFRDRTVFVDTPEQEPDSDEDYYYNQFEGEDQDQLLDDDVLPALPPVTLPQAQPSLPPGHVVRAIDRSTTLIPVIPHPAATVFFVGTPQPGGRQVFTVVASSPITGVERMLLEDNRLVIDIINSTTNLSGALPLPPYLAVRGIRASQFEENISRIVFDLESGTEFSIDITPDRTTIILTIYQHELQDFSFEARDGYDSIVLTGVSPSTIRAQPRTGRLQFFISNAQTEIIIDEPLSGGFATHVNLSQWTQNVILLDLSVHEFTAHTIMQTGINETTIRLQPATYRNIRYNYEERTLRIPRASDFLVNIEHVVRNDLYHSRTFTLWFPVNGMDHLGFGEKLIADAFLRSVNISHTGQGTQLTFNGNQIFALDLQEDDDYYIIRVMHPRERYSRIVIIDPGHGGRFPGAVRDGIREADLNLAVTHKLLQLIEADGFIRAYTTRNTDVHFSSDHATDLRLRSEFGNHIGDIFISIHFNAATGTHVHGTETFFRESVHDNFRALSSRRLAENMQRHKLAVLGTHDREARPANFAVLRYSTIPAALLEIAFMSNPAEFARIQTPEFQWMAARAIYNGLLESFALIPAR